MSRAFIKEDAGGPERRYILPARSDPSYDAAAAMALLEGANQGGDPDPRRPLPELRFPTGRQGAVASRARLHGRNWDQACDARGRRATRHLRLSRVAARPVLPVRPVRADEREDGFYRSRAAQD